MSKAKKKPEKELTFAEITADYRVISEVEKDGYLVSELVTHSGHHVITRIPIRTPERGFPSPCGEKNNSGLQSY